MLTTHYQNIQHHPFCGLYPHEGLTVPKPTDVVIWDLERNTMEKIIAYLGKKKTKKTEFAHKVTSGKPHRIIQNEFTKLLKDLELLKSKRELLGQRVQQWKLLYDKVRVSLFHSPQHT
jgi:hypothetical protein